MKLYEEIGLELDKNAVISVVGGGGKTTTILQVAKELKDTGKIVLVTTSTAILIPNKIYYDNLYIEELPNDFIPEASSITYYAQESDGIKLRTENIEVVDEIISRNIFDYILIEADGSKGLPIKAPALHEPVISKYTTITIGVIGLDSINKKINNTNVHRPELLIILGGEKSNIIDIPLIIKLVIDNNGLFKNSLGKRVLLLNKADTKSRIEDGYKIKDCLGDMDISVLICDVISNFYISK